MLISGRKVSWSVDIERNLQNGERITDQLMYIIEVILLSLYIMVYTCDEREYTLNVASYTVRVCQIIESR